ncbi:MAG: proline--tRNA ligase, partial [Gemmatimonadetes bacterium]|nr:proline--tRNA ligase [Gemmatimonadota bacterium]
MRLSEYLFQTHREPPGEAELVSHQLLLRAGLVRQVASGIFAYLPLGQRVKHRIERIVREEMDAIGGQEVTLPVVQPAELWRESGRWDRIGSEMARLKDRNGRDLCLAMTHEELVTSLVRDVIRSYRQLPCLLYQVQTKFRDEPRPRGGLIRVREYTMKDGYSFHVDAEDLDQWYEKVYQAYTNIFQRCGLDAVAVRSDPGMMGGSDAHEFIELSPS